MVDHDDADRLELALSGTRLGLWDWDMVTGKTVFNERWAEIIGYRLDELGPTTIQTWIEHSNPDDLERSSAAIARHTNGESEFYDVEVRMRHRDGHWVWVHDRGRVVERADDGTPLRMVGTHEDITERVEQRQRLQEAKTFYDHSLEGVVLVDADQVITSVNPAFTAITGWSREQVVGTSLGDLRSHSEDPVESARLQALAHSDKGLRVQRNFFRPDGTSVPVLLSMNRILDPSGQISGFVAQLSDIGERVQDEQDRLDRILYFDQSTGLPNRRNVLDQVEAELRSLRRMDRTSALLLLNLDDFKRINDAFGFEVGELLITIVADRMQSRLRPGDVLARTSGDEFTILLGGVFSRSECESIAQHLLDALDPVCRVPGAGDVYVTACIGTVLLPDGISSAEQALQSATAALHSAKTVGPGTIQHHTEDFVAESRERVVRVAQIRQAWLDGEFRLEYQPMYDVATGALVGAEALMRWTSPILGEVPPATFIPLAEDIGLVTELGNWAINEACRQGSEWITMGLDSISVSVNVTASQLVPDLLIPVVRKALAQWSFPADHLILELTESTLLHATGDTLEILAELGAMGVRVAIDDFGTGYSSFAYLRQYPLDKLKIDRSFIQGLAEQAGARSIAAAIIDLGHHLGLLVLAEGVETPEQLQILRDLKCDLYQGFISSPAVPADELVSLWAAS